MKLKILSLLTAILLILPLASCNSGNDEPTPQQFILFCTLTAKTADACSFQVQKSSETSPVLLTCAEKLPESFIVGKRYVIQYSNGSEDNPFIPGPITLYYAFEPFSGEVNAVGMTEINELVSQPINVYYAERTNQWLNVRSYAYVSNAPLTYGLYLDEETAENEYPDVYIGYKSDFAGASSLSDLFGSFDLTPVMKLTGVKGFTLHYQNNGVKQTQKYEFHN